MKKGIVVFTAWAALLLGFAAGVLPEEALAQRGPNRGVVIAVPVDFPDTNVDDAKAVIYRTGKEEIILLNPDFTTPETLAAAFALLKELRKDKVDAGLTEASVVAGFSVRRAMKAKRRDAFSETLQEIAGQPIGSIGNLGPGQWVLVPRGYGMGRG